jgi:hypothetical protein
MSATLAFSRRRPIAPPHEEAPNGKPIPPFPFLLLTLSSSV